MAAACEGESAWATNFLYHGRPADDPGEDRSVHRATEHNMRALVPIGVLTILGAAGSIAFGQAAPDARAPTSEPPAPPTDSADPAPATSPWSFTIIPRAQHTFSSDLKNGGADASVSRLGVDLDLAYQATERLGLTLNLAPEVSWYDFGAGNALVPGTDDPFNDLYRLDIIPGARYSLNERWTLVGGARFELAGESEADAGQSATFGGYFGGRYAASERFAATFGVLVTSRLEDSAFVLPLIGMEWRITDSLTLAARGAGLRIENRINDDWSVWLGGSYESREFRLAEDSPLPEGVVRDRRVPITIGAKWRAADRITVGLEGGAVIWQQFEIDDRNGDDVNKVRTKPAPFVGVSVTIRF